MLTELRIENFAIIDRLDLDFASGLIAFTGETGAGKSIIFDAVEVLLGGRADATAIRLGSERASIEGVFHLPPDVRQPVHAILEREDLLDDPEYLVLGREIRSNGRNTARVNGRSVNTSLLRELGEFLVDLHGQSEHLSLLRVSQHLRMLDDYAATAPAPGAARGKTPALPALLSTYQDAYRRLQSVRHELENLRQSERDAARRTDMLTYQINEITAARLRLDEEEALREERNRLANAEGLAQASQEALLALDEGSPEAPSATDLLGQAVHALGGLARTDPSQEPLAEQAGALLENLADLSRELRNYLESIEFNPRRLDQVEERLALIHTLKRKYGDSIAAVLAFVEEAQRQLDGILHAGERIADLESEQEQLLEQLATVGQALSAARQQAADQLAKAVEAELSDLHMSGARFQVDFSQRPDPQGVPLPGGERVAFDLHGLEKIEFLIAPNPGEGFKPLVKIASGGETSRLMLALKNVLARADRIPTLIFDEIDQGIGGRVGAVVGQKLWNLARQHQVLCITHLPQLAAFGEQHYQVLKQVHGDRTTTLVRSLNGDERIHELAQMLGEVSEGTLHSARDLIHNAAARTTQNP